MAAGTVKWFDAKKGYGFIAQDEGPDVFVHYSDIENQEGYKTLKDGEPVEFELTKGDIGPKAMKVKATQTA